MSKHSFWKNSICTNSYLHKFAIVDEYEDGVLEVCEICHVRKFFKVIDGKLDNQSYMDWHIANVLPSMHPWYQHQYE